MRFKLRQPCDNCPFRKDVHPYLDRDRAAEIGRELVELERTFTCHKTIDYSKIEECSDEDGNIVSDEWKDIRKNNHCVGAIQFIENCGRPHQMLQVAERLGLYDPKWIDRSVACFESIKAFVKHHGRGK